MTRKIIICSKFLVRRRKWCVPLLLWTVLSVVTLCWLSAVTSRALLPPPPPDQSLHHFRRSTHLQHYLDNIQLLIEPSSVPCEAEVPVIILVTSVPSHVEQRQAIRDTWGKHQPTYFLLGLEGHRVDETLADNYVEAKQHSDMIIYDMMDHYQNLTLKSVLMLQWTLERCPRATYMFKTDDDVMVNPWTLKTVLEEHPGAELLGYRVNDTELHRDEYTKWFVPRWLANGDLVPQYLSGTGYLIRGDCLNKILVAAKKVPLINLEDVYLTYLVSKTSLNLDLVHDRRLSPYRPWVPIDCAYFSLASIHSLKPREMAHAWARIEKIAKEYEKDSAVCDFYKSKIESDIFLY